MRELTAIIICGLSLLTSCSKEDDGEHQSPADDEQPQKVTRWECILFGSYPANEVVSGTFNAVDDYAYAPIKWRILKISGTKAMLLADRMPDTCPFHDKDEDVNWSGSLLVYAHQRLYTQ